MGGENEGFRVMLDLDNEGSWLLISRRRSCNGEERKKGEEREHREGMEEGLILSSATD